MGLEPLPFLLLSLLGRFTLIVLFASVTRKESYGKLQILSCHQNRNRQDNSIGDTWGNYASIALSFLHRLV